MHRSPSDGVGSSAIGWIVAMAVALLALGCAPDPDIAIPRPAGVAGVTPAPGSPGSSSPGAAATAGRSAAPGAAVCGPDTRRAIRDHIANPAVALVGLVGGCRQVSIETTLDSSSVAVGVAICNTAAEVAYALGVGTISVTAADAREIATGTTGSPCSGEP